MQGCETEGKNEWKRRYIGEMLYYSGIAHYINNVLDVFKYKAERKDSFVIVLAARLSGKPHIGTLINFMIGFKLAQELYDTYKKDTVVKIELLDNISDVAISQVLDINSDVYFYKESVVSNETLNENYQAFIDMIKRIKILSNIGSEVYSYEQIQSMPEMRKSIVEVVRYQDFFSKLFNPKHPQLHIRTACPHCGLIEKNCKHTHISMMSNTTFKIDSACPIHGSFSELFAADNNTYIDMNVPLRHFCKGYSLVKMDKENNSLSIQVLGNDWSGIWPLRIFCEGILKVKGEELPSFLFSPLIIDDNGKVSKSKINYTRCPKSFENVNLLTNVQLLSLWNEISKWFNQSDLFFTNYKLDYLKEVTNINE